MRRIIQNSSVRSLGWLPGFIPDFFIPRLSHKENGISPASAYTGSNVPLAHKAG